MAQTVTLYIEDAEIKLLVCNGKQIVKWASLMIDPKLVRDGVILDEETVAREIKKLFETTGTKDKKVIAALSGLNSVFRIITLPATVPQSILDEAIENEAQRVLPVSIDQVYLSYQRISYDKEESHYFLVAHPKNSTDALIRTINSAGLKPQSMDLAPLALARCANEPKAVIVNSWLTYVDIIVMSESIPQVIRTLSLPTDSVALEDKLPLISEEIVRTIAFYNTSFASKALDAATPLLVCGDLTYNEEKLKEILGVLESQFSNTTFLILRSSATHPPLSLLSTQAYSGIHMSRHSPCAAGACPHENTNKTNIKKNGNHSKFDLKQSAAVFQFKTCFFHRSRIRCPDGTCIGWNNAMECV
jgi:type IV pilus assembly protein PilM